MTGPIYPGVYRGIVMDDADPEDLFRLKVQIPGITGQVVSDWAWPSVPLALGVTKPVVGDNVWIVFEGGELDRPVWLGIWRTRYGSGVDPNINYGDVITEVTYGQAPDDGDLMTVSRSDHTHGTPPNLMPAHEAAVDPHPGYVNVTELNAALVPFATDIDMAAEALARANADTAETNARIAADNLKIDKTKLYAIRTYARANFR